MDDQQPTRPRLVPEGEDKSHEAWPATDRQYGWPHSRNDAPIRARSGTGCALALGIIVVEVGEAWIQRGTNSGNGPCLRRETRTS